MSQRVPVTELIDLEGLAPAGERPSTRAIREALPAGWVLEEDGSTARRDLRLLARQGWMLLLLMLVFGSVGLGLFWSSFPRGSKGLLYLLVLIGCVLLAGGLVAPLITRALYRRRPG